MAHPWWYRTVVEVAAVEAAVVVAVVAVVVVAVVAVVAVVVTVVVVAVTAVVAVVVAVTAETEEGEVVQAGVTVQPFPATPFPPVLTARRYRWNSGKMNSQRPRSPQNRVPQLVPEISPGIAALIHPESSDFSFYSR